MNLFVPFILMFLFALKFEVGFAQKSYSEKTMYHGSKNVISLAIALKQDPEKVVGIRIEEYSDTIFPSNNLLIFKNIEHIIIDGKRVLRKKRNDPVAKPTSFHIDINKLNQLTKLRYLEFSYINFNRFPVELCSFKQLKGLSLDFSLIDTLPKEISNLISLEVLSLRLNNISFLPEEIVNLENLLVLDLTNNSINKLPEEILKLKNLNGLALSNVEGRQELNENSYKWPFPIHTNKIDYLYEFKLFTDILKLSQFREVSITVGTDNQKTLIKNEITDKALLKKISWDVADRYPSELRKSKK